MAEIAPPKVIFKYSVILTEEKELFLIIEILRYTQKQRSTERSGVNDRQEYLFASATLLLGAFSILDQMLLQCITYSSH